MNCQSIQNNLPAFFLDDLDTDLWKAVELHLESCADCQAALANLHSLDLHMRTTVIRQMERLHPPAEAWMKIQAELGTPRPKTFPGRKFKPIALVTAVMLLLFALLLVPPVYARLEEIAGFWRIQVPSTGTSVTIDNFQAFVPHVPSSLPRGFDLTTTGTYTSPDTQELQLTYARNKDVFLLVERKSSSFSSLPEGSTVELGGIQAKLLDPANKVEEQYRAVFTTGIIRLLTWSQAGIQIGLYSNMPVEDMLRFARSLHTVRK